MRIWIKLNIRFLLAFFMYFLLIFAVCIMGGGGFGGGGSVSAMLVRIDLAAHRISSTPLTTPPPF